MENKQTNSNLAKIWLIVPNAFLQQFDKETKDNYSSRSEAIRRGMSLLLDKLDQLKTQNLKQENPPILAAQVNDGNRLGGN